MKSKIQIINEKGLHARASAKFVEIVENFDASVTVSKDGINVLGSSIMGLMMLAASKGTYIEINTYGNEAEKLAKALTDLVNTCFGEGC
ncbi:HPr family phosphocarrier protein [Amylibacter sp.]|jgi:phosphocarrier protein|nr:HPr family phosphocarrier protein [Amylibacter sp.]MDB4188256.1 HPr family phosphocarrier protein [bacterium]MDA8854010.1 HPr family phosphocarrier protein [Amylibacter sp.]MDA9005805.1 HPr family phosphocarrier protein [Amylibacter sp.]MDA9178602.1 HPr family phosphocarrier protein [Amylibacter sp.]|tara:strand:- start:1384 stop:1650 length:267 start_codon:yes stop_codon:yes gene_type:complete